MISNLLKYAKTIKQPYTYLYTVKEEYIRVMYY